MEKNNLKPSEEKPWEKYFGKDVVNRPIPHNSLYKALVAENADNLESTAFVMACRNDIEMTYAEFIALADAAAKSMTKLGVTAGKEIAAVFKNTVEGISIVFAKSRLGAFAHLIDPMNNPNEIIRMLYEANAEVLFVAEEFASALIPHLKGTGIGTAVVLPSDTGSCNAEGYAQQEANVLSWNAFLAVGQNVDLLDPYEPGKQEGSIVVYTGGSTGRSKGVILSDYAFVSKYYREVWSKLKWGRGRTELCALPATIAYGLSEGVTIPILAGARGVIVDCYAIPRFAEFVLKYRPQEAACSPIHMQYLVNSPLIDDQTDLSFVKMFPSGGDGMTLEADVMVRSFLAAHGAADSYGQGCGFTETAGAFCFGQGPRNKPGGMGIPLAGNTCGVFDPKTGEELPYGQVGEWAVRTDTAMLGYFGSAADKTQDALKTHPDGQVWLHPGDIVHMDEDGVIFMHDRVSRTFNLNGLKVYPSALETIIALHPAVSKCVVSGVKISDATSAAITEQKVPIANIALSQSCSDNLPSIANEIRNLLSQEAQTYIKIAGFVFREQIPFTSRGKINYQQLEEEALSEGPGRIIVR